MEMGHEHAGNILKVKEGSLYPKKILHRDSGEKKKTHSPSDILILARGDPFLSSHLEDSEIIKLWVFLALKFMLICYNSHTAVIHHLTPVPFAVIVIYLNLGR